MNFDRSLVAEAVSAGLADSADRLDGADRLLWVLAHERLEIVRAIEQAGFRLMESGNSLFLLNVQDESVNPRLAQKVVTTRRHEYGPFAWEAIFATYKEGDVVGHGETEQIAIDWLIAEEAHLIATDRMKEHDILMGEST